MSCWTRRHSVGLFCCDLTRATLKFPKLDAQTQRRERLFKGKAYCPYWLRYKR
ncbi:MAG: hypothetical protein LBJ00_11255 [Planctomycetaceae bacterium]|nr:hypothetical protein [Planctomycetaceae bacterium]